MRNATQPQITKIHVLLTKLGLLDEKALIIYNLTEGRTESTKELSIEEARHLIMNLSEYDPSERLKSLIFSLGYQADILYGTSDADKKMNAAKLNLFLKERGAVKKELNAMTYQELVKIHRQFEAIVKNTRKSWERKHADKVVTNLLDELNINTL